MSKKFYRVCSALLAAWMTASGTVTAFVPETVEPSKESADVSTLAKSLADAVIPGRNLLTGTKEAATFDEAQVSYADAFSVNDGYYDVSVTEDPLDASNHALCVSQYYWMRYGLLSCGYTMEDGRKYHIEFDEHVEKTTLLTTWGALLNKDGSAKSLLHDGKTTLKGKYEHFEAEITADGGAFVYNQRFCAGDGMNSTGCDTAESENAYIYYDNFAIYPYYRITYHDFDGELVYVDEVLLNPDGSFVTSYTPDPSLISEVCAASGFSLEEGGEPVEEVELDGSDIDLYPIWEPLMLSYPATVMSAAEGNTLTVSASEAVYWSFNANGTDASYTFDDMTATVTAHDGAGIVTLEAVMQSDEECVKDVEIRLINGKKAKPGVNVITGTDEPADFEKDGALYAGAFSIGAEYYDKSCAADNLDYTNHALKVSQYYWMRFGTISYRGVTPTAGRKYRLSFDEHVDTETLTTTWGALIDKNGGVCEYLHIDQTDMKTTPHHVSLDFVSDGSALTLSQRFCPADGMNWTGGRESEAENVYIYVDNFSLIPYYQITYHNFDGSTACTDYVLYDADGKKITSYTPDITKVDGALGFSLTEDGDAVGTVTLSDSDIDLYPIGNTVKSGPGINILNGKKTPVTFDGTDAASQLDKFYVNVNNGNFYQEKSLATPSVGTSMAACFMHESWLRYAQLPHSATFTEGKKYAIVFDEYVEKSNGITSTLGVMIDGAASKINAYAHTDMTSLGEGYQHIVIGEYAPGNDSFNYQQRFCSDTETNGVQVRVYIDNFAIYPYYTVTYKNFDGSTAYTDYVLFDEDGKLASVYTPDTSKVADAVGFSLEEGGDKVESVALENKDIVLYPVGEVITSGPGINILNKKKTPVTFDDADAAEQLNKFYVNVNNGIFYQEKSLATPAGGTSKAACFMHESWLRYAQLPHSAAFSEGKKYAIIFDEYVEKSNGITSTFGAMLNGAGTKVNVSVHSDMTSLGTSYQHIVIPDYAPGSDSFNYQQRFCSDSETNGVQVRVYIDNFAIYPYYTITYLNFDGTTAFVDEVLLDENGSLLTEYVPDTSKVKGAAAFALEEGGDAVESVALGNKNITLYPLDTAPIMLKVASIRTRTDDGKGGLRFASFMSDHLKLTADRFGFIVSTEDILGGDASALVFNAAKDAATDTYVSGTAYEKGNLDRVYATDGSIFGAAADGMDEGAFYTAVLTGIGPSHYAENFMVRPYVMIGDKVFYGEVYARSLRDTAKSIRENDYSGLTAEERTVVDNILSEKALDSEARLSEDDAYAFIVTPKLNGEKEGIASGWRLDNRGGIPKSSLYDDYSVLSDISTSAGTALIRPFTPITTGTVEYVISYKIDHAPDGVSFDVCDHDGEYVYSLKAVDGKYCILRSDDTYLPLADTSCEKTTLRIRIDIDNGNVTTFVNRQCLGMYPLAVSAANPDLAELRIATDGKSTAKLTVNSVYGFVNYAVNENGRFDYNSVPEGFAATNAAIDQNGVFVFAPSSAAEKSFAPLNGTVAAEFDFRLEANACLGFMLGDSAAVSADNGKLYVNGEEVYSYLNDLWYRLRLEDDLAAGNITVKLNGRKIGEVPAAGGVSAVSRISFANAGTAVLSVDNMKVFRVASHDDYVPQPVRPAGSDSYDVGVNVCSLWQEGTSFGWSCITPYETPVLGYYDEGSAESADWEIKYMVEHGIDFEAFCWFSDSADGNIKEPVNAGQLRDGYMNAKYADMMKYCLIWEAYNGEIPNSMDAWKNGYVPYLIEHYFKDERYMRIDGMAPLFIFRPEQLKGSDSLGSAASVKEALDYLESEVIKLGYDGVLFFSMNYEGSDLASMGFDGISPYSYGTDGYQSSVGKAKMISSAPVYRVPMASVGFNEVAWEKERYPLMPVSEYADLLAWIKNTYMPLKAKTSWQKRLVMLSTWNEYGEGHYLMPSENNGGFGYLDALRAAFTSETADASVNTVPTKEQKSRVTRAYPQNLTMPRRQYFSDDVYATVKKTQMTSSIISTSVNVNGLTQTDEYVYGTGSGDANLFITDYAADLSNIKSIRIRAQIPVGETMELFFITNKDKQWSQSKSKAVTATTYDFTEYYFDFSDNPEWKDTLYMLRIDPVSMAGSPFAICSIEYQAKTDATPDTIVINDVSAALSLGEEVSVTNEYLVPFDTATALDMKLGVYCIYDKAAKTLEILSQNHTVTFTVGRNTYTVDGAVRPLGFTLYARDGLPMIPVQTLCNALGYPCSCTDGVYTVKTPQYDIVREIASRRDGAWEFNVPGDNEGWYSEHMTAVTENGYIHLASLKAFNDPVVWYRGNISLKAADYTRLVMRVRFRYEPASANSAAMYFTTSKDGGLSESKCLRATLANADTNGEWIELSVDLTQYPTWKDTITSLRFDPFDAHGEMDIDYIRFE